MLDDQRPSVRAKCGLSVSSLPPSARMARAIKRAKDVPEGILRGFWYPQPRDRWMDAVAPTTPAALSAVLLRCAHMSSLTLKGRREGEREREREREGWIERSRVRAGENRAPIDSR